MQFYKRLKTRGWDKRTLEPIFTAAHKQLLSQPEGTNKTQENEISTRDRMILHLEYHPGDIPRKIVRDLWPEHCGEYLSKDIEDSGLGINRTILAYSRPNKLRDVLQKAKMYQKPGKEVTTCF